MAFVGPSDGRRGAVDSRGTSDLLRPLLGREEDCSLMKVSTPLRGTGTGGGERLRRALVVVAQAVRVGAASEISVRYGAANAPSSETSVGYAWRADASDFHCSCMAACYSATAT